MSIADADGTRLAFIEETVEGTTPATPAFQVARYTSENLNLNVETITSNEIRPDRNVSDLIHVGNNANGPIECEMSYGSYDPWFESLLGGAWSSDELKISNLRKSFTFEKTFETGTPDNYIRYTGCLIGALAMSLNSKQIETMSFEVLGRGGSTGTSIITGATYTAANTNDVHDAANAISGLAFTGMSGTNVIRNLDLNINANLREQPQIGSVDLAGVGLGRLEVTGSAEIYFQDNNALQDALNQTARALTFTTGKVTNEKYTFDIPKLKFSNPRVVAGGNSTDVVTQIDFQGLYDSGEATSFKITRAVA